MATRAHDTRSTSSTRSGPRRRSGSSGNTATVIGAAAAGLAAGLVANLGRRVAMQAPSALAGDWFEALKAEHRATLALFDAMEATKDNQAHRRSTLLMQIKHALSKHAFTEENVIYPSLRDAGATEDADRLNHQHGYVKQYLFDLEHMERSDPAFLGKVREFRRDLEAHIRDEEDNIFPPLHAKLSTEKNKAITFAANKEGFKLA